MVGSGLQTWQRGRQSGGSCGNDQSESPATKGPRRTYDVSRDILTGCRAVAMSDYRAGELRVLCCRLRPAERAHFPSHAPSMLVSGSACRRCRRCPRRTEFVSRRDLRYLLRFGHNLANALDEGCGTERLLPQDHLNSGIQPRMILDRKVARSDDNDRDLVPDRMLLHLCYELESVHLWHHQIENDDVRNAFLEPVEGDTPILGLDQQPCLGSQPGSNALSLHCVILDDQDPGWSGRRSIFRNQIHQLLAVDRLREIPNSPQRHAMPPLVYDRRHDGRNVCKLRVAA